VRRLLALLLASVMLLATAACGGDSGGDKDQPKVDMGEKIKGLSVSGKFGVSPTVKVDPEVKVDKAQTQVITKGDGDPVKVGGKALLHLYIAKGKDGSKAVATYDEGKPLSATMDDKQFFPALIKALKGKPSGTRLAFADTVKDLYGASGASQIGLKTTDSLVFVVDIVSVTPSDVLKGPKGDKVDAPADLPTLEETDGKITSLGFTKAPKKPSSKLQVIPLVKGKGEKIDGAKIVTMDYLGQVYGSAKPFNNTYPDSPTSFDVGIGGLIPGWDKALEGQRVGSRVMLIVPPADGYGKSGNPDIKVTGTSTLVFLIDILGVG
jgi:FKBP-type peptidyl-prolyl cis-trans isomerase